MIISIGRSRKDKYWKPTDYTWDGLCAKLSKTFVTSETIAEYKAMPKDSKAEKKDVGGFVGGTVMNGRRTKANVTSRSLITLDADFATPETWDNVEVTFENALCCYSTHSHTPSLPRLRFVIPLDREVSPEEYEPIARMIASDIGIDIFDVTTYETSRLMYWPSTSVDGSFFFRRIDGPVVSADSTLERYTDWHDTSEWPLGSTETKIITKQAKAQGEPESKAGVVGMFCRTYNIYSAIDKFLPDVYSPCGGDRYTYIDGSTTAGAVVYDNGAFLFSHHSTDPAGGQLCNAFDLVRLHKFGNLDYKVDIDTPITKMPSYKAMAEFVGQDDEVKRLSMEEGLEKAKQAFGESSEEDDLDWTKRLKFTPQGILDSTIDNLVVILDNDPNLTGCFAMNEFKGIPCRVKDTIWAKCKDTDNGDQWSDEDSAALAHYVETTYNIYSPAKLNSAISVVMMRHSFHPVRNYLNALEWDGEPRGETLFITYLGAENNLYTRTVTRKWLTAAVARVMNPGCKFDNLVVLVGAQGIGKSYLGKQLGRGWFSDTMTTVQGKDAYDQLKGCWVIEIAELSAMKKAEVEAVKMFISKQEDNYRAAYKMFPSANKRQCVFYGTTNDDGFLRDATGNRRFWPIGVDKDNAAKDVFDLTDYEMDQIWAEALHWYKSGEELYLPADVVPLAAKAQEEYTTLDPKTGAIEEFLNTKIPDNWEELSKTDRRNFIQGYTTTDRPLVERTTVSCVEIGYELFGKEILEAWEAKDYGNIMKSLSDWKKTGRTVRSVYGKQRIFERISSNVEDEEADYLD